MLELLKTASLTPANAVTFDVENDITTSVRGQSFMAKLHYYVKELNRFKGISAPFFRLMVSFTILCNA